MPELTARTITETETREVIIIEDEIVAAIKNIETNIISLQAELEKWKQRKTRIENNGRQ